MSPLMDERSKREFMDEHKHEHHHEDRQADAKSNPLRVLSAAAPMPDRDEHPAGPTLDLSAVHAKLRAKTGKQYWRSLVEFAGDPQFEELLHRDFPRQAPSEWWSKAMKGAPQKVRVIRITLQVWARRMLLPRRPFSICTSRTARKSSP